MATSALLGFLADVREHNSLAWMHANEDRKKAAQQEFLALVQTCIDDLAAQGEQVGHLDPKSLVFRINRDTRFSNDKSPYNPVFRAHISPAGRAPVPVGYFVSIAPGNSFAGGGLFAPRLKEAVKLVRDAIAADPETFLSLVEDEAFRARFAFIGMPLKRMPQGYDAENPAAEYLRCTCWSIEEAIADAVVEDEKALRERLIDSFLSMRAFNVYLNEALEGFAFPMRS